MRKKFNGKESAGSLMIEAMAMLALIAMVTPILYKKAAERTTELKDINAASQMRVMISAVDNYIKDHYAEISAGEKVDTQCPVAAEQDYAALQGDTDAAVEITNLAHLCEYFPYGFIDNAGNIRGSNAFSDYQLAIAKKVSPSNPDNASLTGFLLTEPRTPLSMVRASRIASMIGSNGGYMEGQTANGVQGVWKIDDIGTLGLDSKSDGSIIAASLQSINKGSVMNEDVLYRNFMGDTELNTMHTTLYMDNNDIEGVNNLIAKTADIEDQLTAGSAEIDGNLSAGSADVSGALTAGTADVAGKLTAGSADVTGALTAGTAAIQGQLTAAGDKFKVEDGTGNTTIGGDASIAGGLTAAGDKFKVDKDTGDTTVDANLNVTGNADIGGDLTVSGNTTLETLRVNQTSSFGGDATFESNVQINNNLNVDGAITTPKLLSKTLKGGLIGVDFSDNPDNDQYVFTAQWANGNPNNAKVLMGPNDEVVVGNKTIDMNVDGTKIEMAPYGGSVMIAPGGTASPELYVTQGQTLVDNGSFVVSTGPSTDLNQFQTEDDQIDFFVKPSTEDSILTVTNKTEQTKGSVQVRQGVVEIASNYTDTHEDLPSGTGYVLADRFIDQKAWEDSAIPDVSGISGSSTPAPDYDAYQVNPAYTSVMHDIKLTTRGGARLSDILPDFINKGIYVVDNSYDENVPYWGNLDVSVSGGVLKADIKSGAVCSSHTCWTSPWLGLIPTPLCPPGYARVVTISPAGWAMGQAGIPGSTVGNNRQDLWTPDYPKNPNDYAEGDLDAPYPLYFQKSTWLRANLYPHSNSGEFMGWSAIMGFMYPYAYYTDYINDLGLGGELTGGSSDSEKVIWNLFPVLKRQLEAYVTVYCYFDRTNSRYDNAYVDKYDQLNDYRTSYTKDGAYVDRLNDPQLSYDDIW